MRYLIKRGKKAGRKVAHLWDGIDTVCHMASSGGLQRFRYLVAANPYHISPHAELTVLPVCVMCSKVYEKQQLELEL